MRESLSSPAALAAPLDLPRLLTEEEAATFLGLRPDTMKVWRSKSRRAGRLIGPLWTEMGDGRARIIRYRIEVLEAYAAAGVVRLEPKKKIGRPRKSAAA
ncbi:MAG: hypothetical protein HYU59_05135 [Magnetospirillum gryphiswaldense]|nr:hypothetical protein [Magnetospirillum gryphiswaldense]